MNSPEVYHQHGHQPWQLSRTGALTAGGVQYSRWSCDLCATITLVPIATEDHQ